LTCSTFSATVAGMLRAPFLLLSPRPTILRSAPASFLVAAGVLAAAALAGCGDEGAPGDSAVFNNAAGAPAQGTVPSAPVSTGTVPPTGAATDTAPTVPPPATLTPDNPGQAGMGTQGMPGEPGAAGAPVIDTGNMNPPGAGGMDAQGTGGAAPAAGAGNANDCTIPPPPSPLVGWATEGAGTTGGGALTPQVVTTAGALNTAIGGNQPAVIHVMGTLQGSFDVGSNKTIVGICGAELQGDVNLNGSTNVIMRNLRVVGRNCTDSPNDCSAGEDAIGVNGGSNHIWFDHLDVSDGSDGNLDITQGSDFITISWTRFSYSSMRTDALLGASGHRFSNLVGASDTDPLDVGHLNLTYHHCWWAENVNQRMPRTRRGQIHLFNNLFTSTGNSVCTNAGQDARLLVENSLYLNVTGPLQLTQNGDIRSVNNVFVGTSGGTTNPGGTGFTPPYTYQPDATDGLEAALRAGVGPQ
jgi:pectate lyase